MIMAAGLATRLGTISKDTPKVLLDVNGKTVLERIVEKMLADGFDDIIINVHHLADKVTAAVKELESSLGVKITISDETGGLLETGGGLFRARDFFGDRPFMVYNGDILTDLSLKKMYDYHIRKGALSTVAVRERPGNRAFLVDDGGVIRGWTNRKNSMDIITIDEPVNLSEIPSMAIAVYDPAIFDYMEEGKYTMTPILIKASAGGRVIAFRYDRGYWVDIGTADQLEKAREIL